MNDKYKETFSIEEIEAAFSKGNYIGEDGLYYEPGDLIAELQRPKQVFKEGEVVFARYLEDDQPTGGYFQIQINDDDFTHCRSLNRTECPWGGVAIDALESIRITKIGEGFTDPRDAAGEALNKIKVMIGEE